MLGTYVNTILCNRLAQLAPVQYQTLRWKRKPRKPFWLGTAKSKIFRIHDQPELPQEERRELLRLTANYKSAIKSIRQYLIEQEQEKKQVTGQLATEEEMQESLRKNDEWNAQCARARAERLEAEQNEHDEAALIVIETKDKQNKLIMDKVEELVRLEKERSKYFVTRENLDAKVEECLDSHTDYNYAIDLQGNMYTGFLADMKLISKQEEETGLSPQQASRSA